MEMLITQFVIAIITTLIGLTLRIYTINFIPNEETNRESFDFIISRKLQMIDDQITQTIDRNKLFVGTAAKEDRSIMNVCFVMNEPYKDKEEEFLNYAKSCGMVGVKGHRSVGGFRASIYNACPTESVDALVACMQEFEKNN